MKGIELLRSAKVFSADSGMTVWIDRGGGFCSQSVAKGSKQQFPHHLSMCWTPTQNMILVLHQSRRSKLSQAGQEVLSGPRWKKFRMFSLTHRRLHHLRRRQATKGWISIEGLLRRSCQHQTCPSLWTSRNDGRRLQMSWRGRGVCLTDGHPTLHPLCHRLLPRRR